MECSGIEYKRKCCRQCIIAVAIDNTMETGRKDHYQCNLCEKSYSYPGTLKTHMLMSHSKVESYTCNQCDFLWISMEDLKIHTQIHIKETSKICNVCEFQCGTATDMDEHMRRCQIKVQFECKRT